MGGETTLAVNTEIMAEFPPEVVAEVTPILAKMAPLLEEVVPLLNELPAEIMLMMTSAIQASMVRVQLVKTIVRLLPTAKLSAEGLESTFPPPSNPTLLKMPSMTQLMSNEHE
jgi:hypothetical protein